MTRYKNVNIKLSYLQLKKLKPTIKDTTEITLRLYLDRISKYELIFPHKILLTDRKVANIHIQKCFANNSSADVKLSNTYVSKIFQSGGLLWKLFGKKLKIGLSLAIS